MQIYVKSKEGEYKSYDGDGGDVILLKLMDKDKENLKNMGSATMMAFFTDDKPFESVEDVISYMLNGESPDETLRKLREQLHLDR